jgi:hypothetical protein
LPEITGCFGADAYQLGQAFVGRRRYLGVGFNRAGKQVVNLFDQRVGQLRILNQVG